MSTTTDLAPPELGALLRHWRSVRGMSQLDLASEAGSTPRYVSFVETGRSSPSRQMVVRLARALDVPLRERNELLLAAGFAPLYTREALDSPLLQRVETALTSMLAQHDPFPAVVMDRAWNLQRANDGAVHLFTRLFAPTPMPDAANVLRLVIEPGPVRERIKNWDEVVPALVERARREAVGGVYDPETAELVAALVPRRRRAAPHRSGDGSGPRARGRPPVRGRWRRALVLLGCIYGRHTDRRDGPGAATGGLLPVGRLHPCPLVGHAHQRIAARVVTAAGREVFMTSARA
jgi:transcriptional regulator with XRE-family HTH domain